MCRRQSPADLNQISGSGQTALETLVEPFRRAIDLSKQEIIAFAVDGSPISNPAKSAKLENAINQRFGSVDTFRKLCARAPA